ncbi:hypothetical protein QR680_002279 [Steinernema hermaphroditum]|uniref:B box-type domain-containing protein n=1 Tax=Steinernema hermaphroditum TaxID=289476 RepID=A0AA39H487_9BILA|nr:hypothetical protein QR680_002279 [Steinernema hermaphroditum]
MISNIYMDEEFPFVALPDPESLNEAPVRRRHNFVIMNGGIPFEDQLLERDRELCNECNLNKIAYTLCTGCVTVFCGSCVNEHLQKMTCNGDTKRFIDVDNLLKRPPYCERHPGNVCTVFCNRCLAFTCQACIEVDGVRNDDCSAHLASSAGMYRELQTKAKQALQEVHFWIHTLGNLQTQIENRIGHLNRLKLNADEMQQQRIAIKMEVFVDATRKVNEASTYLNSCREFADEYDQRDYVSVADLLKVTQILDFEPSREYLNVLVQDTIFHMRHMHYAPNCEALNCQPSMGVLVDREPIHFESCLAMAGTEMFDRVSSIAFTGDLGEDSRLMVVDRNRSACYILPLGEPLSRFVNGSIKMHYRGLKAIFSEKTEKFVVSPMGSPAQIVAFDLDGNAEKHGSHDNNTVIVDMCTGRHQETVLLERNPQFVEISVIDSTPTKNSFRPGPDVLRNPIAIAADDRGDYLLLDRHFNQVRVIDNAGNLKHSFGSADYLKIPVAIEYDMVKGRVLVASVSEGQNFLTIYDKRYNLEKAFELRGMRGMITSISYASSNVLFVSTGHFVYSFSSRAFEADA